MHVEKFMELGLNVLYANKKKQTIVNWNDLFRSQPNNEGFSHYISSFMSIVYRIINNVSPPRILPKAQSLLQLSKYLKVVDWFSFEDYT